MMRWRRFLGRLLRPRRADYPLSAAHQVGARDPGPVEGFVLRLTALGSTWIDGVYVGEREARDRAHEMARRRPEITDAHVLEYRHARAVRCHHIRLARD